MKVFAFIGIVVVVGAVLLLLRIVATKRGRSRDD
jgi:hypothetical protein